MWMWPLFALRVNAEAIRQGQEHLRPKWEHDWRSAFEKYESEESLQRANTIPSVDHAAATRLHACLEAAELATDPKFRESVARVARVTLDWICDDSTYRPNNHGLMTSIALLNWHLAVERRTGETRVKDIAVSRIVDLANKAFDEDGMWDENTVGYHNFNLRCYDQVLQLHESESIDPALDQQLRPVLDRSDVALGHCLLQDNTIPTGGCFYGFRQAARATVGGVGSW